jgi:hypothetical protein
VAKQSGGRGTESEGTMWERTRDESEEGRAGIVVSDMSNPCEG